MTCKNCKQNFNGNFCNNCGQKSNVGKVDFKYLLDEIPNSLLQIDRGILFTIKELFTKPGHSIREFLEGKRKPHYKPLAFLLVTSTLYILSAYLFDRDTFLDDLISGYKKAMNEHNESSGLKALNWISRNQTYISLILLPLFSLASYLTFKKSKYNYFEHLVINFYITGQQFIIYFILSFIFFKENILLITPIIIGIIYNFWVFNQFFKNKKTIKNVLLVTLTYILYIIELFILIIIITGIVVICK